MVMESYWRDLLILCWRMTAYLAFMKTRVLLIVHSRCRKSSLLMAKIFGLLIPAILDWDWFCQDLLGRRILIICVCDQIPQMAISISLTQVWHPVLIRCRFVCANWMKLPVVLYGMRIFRMPIQALRFLVSRYTARFPVKIMRLSLMMEVMTSEVMLSNSETWWQLTGVCWV